MRVTTHTITEEADELLLKVAREYVRGLLTDDELVFRLRSVRQDELRLLDSLRVLAQHFGLDADS
jgi:hypothetical protein